LKRIGLLAGTGSAVLRGVLIVPINDASLGSTAPLLITLLTAVLLLVLCANVDSLQLARTTERHRKRPCGLPSARGGGTAGR
jgi:hypothetical protein